MSLPWQRWMGRRRSCMYTKCSYPIICYLYSSWHVVNAMDNRLVMRYICKIWYKYFLHRITIYYLLFALSKPTENCVWIKINQFGFWEASHTRSDQLTAGRCFRTLLEPCAFSYSLQEIPTAFSTPMSYNNSTSVRGEFSNVVVTSGNVLDICFNSIYIDNKDGRR